MALIPKFTSLAQPYGRPKKLAAYHHTTNGEEKREFTGLCLQGLPLFGGSVAWVTDRGEQSEVVIANISSLSVHS